MIKRIGVVLVLLILCLVGLLYWFFPRKPETPLEPPLKFRQVTFAKLPGWSHANTRKSFQAFQLSCRTFLRQNPDKMVGNDYISLQVKDWQPACKAARSINSRSLKQTKAFFQKWFTPVEFFKNNSVEGLFTGYYLPLLQGSLTKTARFNIPIYGLPKDLITVNLEAFDPHLKHRKLVGRVKAQQLVPYYTRREISQGAIDDKAPVVAWVDNPVDCLFMEIQGSGVIALQDGSQLLINYVAENGAPYSSIAQILINNGTMTRDNASMQHIKRYFHEHPDQIMSILNQNKSFVFFSVLSQKGALGSQGVVLTPGYSLAIDKKFIPIGAPVWLNTTKPSKIMDQYEALQRLVIAQDTGGAIKGMVRGDVYWGAGEHAVHTAGRMKNRGYYWILIPKHAVKQLQYELV